MPLTIETVPLSTLIPHPRNYRRHTEEQLRHIAESLRAFGLYRNVVACRDGTLLAGHGVVLGARSLGWTEIEIRRLDVEPDSPAALKVLALDNEVSKIADVDDRALTEILRDVRDSDIGLLGTGYDDARLAALLMVTRHRSEIPGATAATEWVGMPEADFGGDPIVLKLLFASEADRDRAMVVLGIPENGVERGRAAWSGRWPPGQANDDLTSVRVVSDETP